MALYQDCARPKGYFTAAAREHPHTTAGRLMCKQVNAESRACGRYEQWDPEERTNAWRWERAYSMRGNIDKSLLMDDTLYGRRVEQGKMRAL